MSTAAELLDLAYAAGLHLTVYQGRLVVTGKRPPAELLANLREHKGALLSLLASPAPEENDEATLRQRWGGVPEEALPWALGLDVLPEEAEALLFPYLGRMPPEVGIWLARRAGEYQQRNPAWTERQCMGTAGVDLVLWQQPRMIPTPGVHLRGQAVGRFLDLHTDQRP